MEINSFLSPGRSLCRAPGASKKRVLENLAHFIHEDTPSLDADELFDKLVARERLGSTGLGQGIAIPHCRIKDCDHIIGCLVSLAEPIDFDAVDHQPVDLLFVLLVPEQAQDEHLTALATLAERFQQAEFCQALRAAESNQQLFEAATR
jgi:PTS system nitrogen regulatory IIA component